MTTVPVDPLARLGTPGKRTRWRRRRAGSADGAQHLSPRPGPGAERPLGNGDGPPCGARRAGETPL